MSTPSPKWTDRRLVDACLKGQDQAWEALVDKFEKLVFAIILDRGVSSPEAADVFQTVWFDACKGLHTLRNKDSFKAWLTSLTLNRCRRWHRYQAQGQEIEQEEVPDPVEDPTIVQDLMNEQLVREAVTALPERCQEMIRLLFFTFPPKPYKEVAEQLELAVGSIGFIRGRCLEKLRHSLVALGLDSPP